MRNLLMFLFFLLLVQAVYAQQDSSSKNNIFAVNLLSPINKEVQISYETLVLPNISIEFTGGYRFGHTGNRIEYTNNFIENLDFSARYKSSIFSSVAVKQFSRSTKALKDSYLSLQGFYRYNFHERKRVIISSMQDGEYSDLSYKQNVFGLKVLLGRRSELFSIGSKASAIIEYYGGIGARYKLTEKMFYTEVVPKPYSPSTFITHDPPKVEKTVFILPSFHFGLKAGIVF